MRTTAEILTDARNGKQPTHDECYWAMLAFDHMSAWLAVELRALQRRAPGDQYLSEVVHKAMTRHTAALHRDPQAYVGDDAPGSEHYAERRRLAQGMFGALLAEHVDPAKRVMCGCGFVHGPAERCGPW